MDLSDIIDKKHHELLRVTNASLVTLFWNLGRELNAHESHAHIPFLSAGLVGQYGPYFTEKGLKMMLRLYDQFPKAADLQRIAPFITWEHLQLILLMEDPGTALFHIRRAIEQDLSLGKLPILDQQIKGPSNLFTEPLLSSYRPLLDPVKGTHTGHELSGVLIGQIEAYRHQHNRWINGFLNMAFWEFGRKMMEEQEGAKPQTFPPSVRKRLSEMEEFARKLPEMPIAGWIGHLLPWRHIQVLLPLTEVEAMLFYARLAAMEGLGVTVLRRRMAAKLYEQTTGAKEKEEKLMATLRNRRVGKRKGGVQITIVDVNYQGLKDNVLVSNIFTNPFLGVIATANVSGRAKKL